MKFKIYHTIGFWIFLGLFLALISTILVSGGRIDPVTFGVQAFFCTINLIISLIQYTEGVALELKKEIKESKQS